MVSEDRLIHDWLVKRLQARLSKEYREVIDNLVGNKNEFHGHYPDLILGNHGMILAVVEVETEDSISDEKASVWKDLADSGTKLIIMVPKRSVKTVTSLLWNASIADKVSVGTYEVAINMP